MWTTHASSCCCSRSSIAACADVVPTQLAERSQLVTTVVWNNLDVPRVRDVLRAARAEAAFEQPVIEELTHESAILKRRQFASGREAFAVEQKRPLDQTLDGDLVAVAAESGTLQQAEPADGKHTQSARRSRRTFRAGRAGAAHR